MNFFVRFLFDPIFNVAITHGLKLLIIESGDKTFQTITEESSFIVAVFGFKEASLQLGLHVFLEHAFLAHVVH